jgi:hypothetical protein
MNSMIKHAKQIIATPAFNFVTSKTRRRAHGEPGHATRDLCPVRGCLDLLIDGLRFKTSLR